MALNETYFRYLADEALGKDWQRLATHLDLKQAEIDRFKADNQFNMANQCFDMLIAWSRKQTSLGDAATLIFLNALEKAGRVDLADKLRERMPSAGQAAGASEETDAGVHITANIFIDPQPEKAEQRQQSASYQPQQSASSQQQQSASYQPQQSASSQQQQSASSQQKAQASNRYTYDSKSGTGGVHINKVTITGKNNPVIMGSMKDCTFNFN